MLHLAFLCNGGETGNGGTKIHRMVNQDASGLVKKTQSTRLLEVWGIFPSQICIFLCTKWSKTIRKRTVRLNCATRRFAAQQRSLGRIDGYFRRLEPVVLWISLCIARCWARWGFGSYCNLFLGLCQTLRVKGFGEKRKEQQDNQSAVLVCLVV